jgi:hypothetical protein
LSNLKSLILWHDGGWDCPRAIHCGWLSNTLWPEAFVAASFHHLSSIGTLFSLWCAALHCLQSVMANFQSSSVIVLIHWSGVKELLGVIPNNKCWCLSSSPWLSYHKRIDPIQSCTAIQRHTGGLPWLVHWVVAMPEVQFSFNQSSWSYCHKLVSPWCLRSVVFEDGAKRFFRPQFELYIGFHTDSIGCD